MLGYGKRLPMRSTGKPMIEYLWRGQAEPARSVLPAQSWAYNGDVPPMTTDPRRQNKCSMRRAIRP